MADFQKFDLFVDALAKKKHDLSSDSLKYALVASANAPNLSTNDTLSDLTQIDYTNCSSRAVTRLGATTTAGQFSLTLDDLTLSASGGVVGPFRYVVLYNDTATNDDLIGMWDQEADITIADGDQINLLLTDSSKALTIQ